MRRGDTPLQPLLGHQRHPEPCKPPQTTPWGADTTPTSISMRKKHPFRDPLCLTSDPTGARVTPHPPGSELRPPVIVVIGSPECATLKVGFASPEPPNLCRSPLKAALWPSSDRRGGSASSERQNSVLERREAAREGQGRPLKAILAQAAPLQLLSAPLSSSGKINLLCSGKTIPAPRKKPLSCPEVWAPPRFGLRGSGRESPGGVLSCSPGLFFPLSGHLEKLRAWGLLISQHIWRAHLGLLSPLRGEGGD